MSFQANKEISCVSYAVGLNMADYLLRLPVALERTTVIEGLADRFAEAPKLDPADYEKYMHLFQSMLQDAAQKQQSEQAESNAAAGKTYRDEFEKKPNVKKTASGLLYEILSEGKGPKPAQSDTVQVHYVGTLIDGTEFDSSVRRGQPAEFGVTQVIPGWVEALQMMNVGSKYRLVIAPELAYGKRGAGEQIGPDSTLVFEVELMKIL